MGNTIRIGSRLYQETSHGEFEIPLADLGPLRFNEVPPFSQLEIHGLPATADLFKVTVSAMHAGGAASAGVYSISVKIFFAVPGSPDNPTATAKCARIKRHLRRIFEPVTQGHGFTCGPEWVPFFYESGKLICVESFYKNYEWQDNPVLVRAVEPFVARLSELASFTDTLLFLCHASEDKPFVDSLCSFLDSSDVPVWYDRREIRVGDSIVERVGDGLGVASHLVVVLSEASVEKAWVRKEFTAALMRQLQDSSIRVLPVLATDCQIPLLIADLRYADCRTDRLKGFAELLSTVT